jgi:hypothetical protein
VYYRVVEILAAAAIGAAALGLLLHRRARHRPAGRALAEAARRLSLSFRPGGFLAPPRALGRHGGRAVALVAGAGGVAIRTSWAGAPSRGEVLVECAAPPPRRWPPLGLDAAFETRIGVRGGVGAARLVLSPAVRAAVEEIVETAGGVRLEVAAPRWNGRGVLTLRVGAVSADDIEAILAALRRVAEAIERSPAFAERA